MTRKARIVEVGQQGREKENNVPEININWAVLWRMDPMRIYF